ncbi:T9SS type A sorting domain-containing protein [Neolewinella persica]|uniref:T9SS type A sorting domain-containing protein n=1 Tax=Neolewinella persica TaxID=70998 RepID=UPI00037F337C|nr:T9SS type A sorting domain-containing protein [Neolewinella persica]
MKQFLLLLCLAVFTGGLSAQVFVNAAAAPGGDGTSWATAYSSLSDALTAASTGDELWVAAGTYTTPADSSFYIDKTLSVLGGFAGTETAAGAADPAANVTILSGDVMGNDGATYDSLSYVDNHRVLVVVDTSAMGGLITVTLDGMTITNGGVATEVTAADPSIVPFSGGGLFSSAKLVASRLTFNKNRANYGSAVALIAASESVLDSLSFDDNYSSINRWVYVNGSDDVVIKNSTFNSDPDVVQETGFIRVFGSNRFTVENSDFSNMNCAVSGAGVRAEQSDDIVIRGCTFDNQIAPRGGAAYFIQADDFVPESGVMDGDDFIIEDCTVTGSIASSIGSVVGIFNTNLQVKNSTMSGNSGGAAGGVIFHQIADSRSYTTILDNSNFTDNVGGGSGAAYFLGVFGAASMEGTVDNCLFNQNTNGSSSGGGMYLQGVNNFTVSNSRFEENMSGTGSSILTNGFAGLTVNNCEFSNNGNSTDAFRGTISTFFDDDSAGLMVDSSSFSDNSVTDRSGALSGGAAMYFLGGDTKAVPLIIKNSTFSRNGANADRSGGALLLAGSVDLLIDNSEFIDNSAAGDGGAINATSGVSSRDTVDGVETMVNYDVWFAEIRNSKFINSTSGSQGGAISTQRIGIDLTNCVFVNNIVGGAGSGGAIIFNGNAPGIDDDGNVVNVGGVQINATLANNTFVDNAKGDGEGAVGASLALFQPGDTEDADSNSMKITLTNNAFLSTTGDPAIEVELGADEPGGFVPVGNLFFESLGGNYFNAENGPEVELGDNGDVFNEDLEGDDVTDLFVDILNDNDEGVNAQLSVGMDLGASNPLIDGGVINALTPDTDLDGFPRGMTYDIGAYEVDGNLTETNEPVENSGLELSFYPNPTMGELNIQNDDASISTFRVIVSDQAGRILRATRFNGVSNRMDFSNLPMGVYNLQLYVNGSVYSKQIVKQ